MGYTPNHPGGNGKANGKGVGDLPSGVMKSQKMSDRATENTDPMRKDDKVERVVGE
jgi:hypothetical protein